MTDYAQLYDEIRRLAEAADLRLKWNDPTDKLALKVKAAWDRVNA